MLSITVSDKVDSFMQQTVVALSATTALASNKAYTGAISTRTVTLPASPLTGEQILYQGTAAAETVITWPGTKVRQVGGAGYITSTTFAIGNVAFNLEFDGTDWYLTDSSAPEFGKLTFLEGSNTCTGDVVLASGVGSVSNTAAIAKMGVIFSMKTASGVVTYHPYADTITPGVGFTVKAGTGDNSTWKYFLVFHQ